MSASLTVGICAYNEELNIDKLLNNIIDSQKPPVNSEILVVCSGCTDDTVKIVKRFEKKDSRIKPIIEEQRTGKASAVNKILSKAKGELILFISADTLPETSGA